MDKCGGRGSKLRRVRKTILRSCSCATLVRRQGEQRPIPKSSIDSTLCSNSVTSRREEFGDAGSIKPCLRKTKRGSQTGTACTNNNCIIFMVYHRILSRYMRLQPVRNYPYGGTEPRPLLREGAAMSVSSGLREGGQIPEWRQLDGQRQKPGTPAIDRMSSTRNSPSESTKDRKAREKKVGNYGA